MCVAANALWIALVGDTGLCASQAVSLSQMKSMAASVRSPVSIARTVVASSAYVVLGDVPRAQL